LHKIVDNLKYIAAIELMNAAQGIEFRRPLKSSPYIESVLAAYRAEVPFVTDDVVMTDYITATMKFLDRFDVVVP
jgi:histidine ammonia-lyase